MLLINKIVLFYLDPKSTQIEPFLVNGGQQGRQPVIIHLTMGVQKDDNIAGRRHGAVVTRADQTLALLVAHNLDLGVVRVLGQVVQLLVQVLQL